MQLLDDTTGLSAVTGQLSSSADTFLDIVNSVSALLSLLP